MFEEYNDISVKDAEEKLKKIESEYEELLIIEKRNDKRIRKGLLWWLLIPVVGLFIYSVTLSKRRNKEQNYKDIVSIKEKLVYLELEIQYIKNKVLIKETN
ncbi:hypothetical protein [Spiroplasma turonicum]|uniref:Transmembrane protein n=1 Tax=Spiroplasma turonicum TaxID=216946 RepID=A0A0K1P606_9MOLU|nr:hypothetical protein [Spiroplasma turonicum]AKU79736.1 hypothetical protein STURON_00490 [Spiroplasma turonicum]ALX70754.1 hypothetical protein STURO_v1c04880 [Spiroplasma turonicum]